MIFGDITKISSADIPDGADVIIGGFPCQGFSVANTRRSMEDKRNFLYKEMLRIIEDKKPNFFVAENVKGILADCPYDAPSNIIKKVLGTDMGMPVKFVYPLIRFGGILYGKFNLDAASPVEAVKNSKVPILLIHGDDDRFVPCTMSVDCQAAAKDNVDLVLIKGAGHGISHCVDAPSYEKAVFAFFEKTQKR